MTELAASIARARVDRIKSHISAAWSDIVAAHRDRDWIALGYDSWDAMCVGEFGGARIALPLEDRRAIVADLRSEGMSTRAIGSALGVTHVTVQRDLSGGTNVPPDVTGLDGKTYSPRHAIVDLGTGEVLNDLVTSEQWQAENPLEQMLSSDPDIRAANLRSRASSLLAYLYRPHPDADELASTDPELTQELADRLLSLATNYRAALPNRLAIVKES